jgi:hypothetical protein
MRNEAECEETDVSSSPGRNIGNRALRCCGHIEQMRGGRVPVTTRRKIRRVGRRRRKRRRKVVDVDVENEEEEEEDVE